MATKKQNLLDAKKDKFRENYKEMVKDGKDAPQPSKVAKKKPDNDILKKNAAATKRPVTATVKRPVTATVGASKGTTNINIKGAGAGLNYTIGNEGPGMFSKQLDSTGLVAPLEFKKKPTARDMIIDELKAYHAKPNKKKENEIKSKCANLNINYDQAFNKSKEIYMKEKAKAKLENPAGLEDKVAKRITNGNKLIENLKASPDPTPYADSILAAARYNKLRILEAHISYYSDTQGVRAQKINQSDIASGRSALHYLSYMGNSSMIQLLGATDQMKMFYLDSRDRTCMHYAAIKGKTSLINTIFLLFKQYGGKMERSHIDPNAVEETGVPTGKTDLEKLNADIEKIKKNETMNSIKKMLLSKVDREKQEMNSILAVVDMLWGAYDNDNNGYLDMDEFKNLAENYLEIDEEAELGQKDKFQELVDKYDEDQSKTIDKMEMVKVFRELMGPKPEREFLPQKEKEEVGDEEEKYDEDKENDAMESTNIKITAGGQDDNAEPEEDQMNKKNENDVEATELGASELAFEDRMIKEMDRSDGVFVNGQSFSPISRDLQNQENGGQQQTNMKSIINFRDHMGRTPLHIAAIWGNKNVCETLLHLKANPLIADGGGKKPIDYVDQNSAIADLLRNMMSRASPPTLHPWGNVDVSMKSASGLKNKMMSAIETKQNGGKPGLPLSLYDIKQLSQEALQTIKLGDTNDNYLQACVKAQKMESIIHLKTEVGGFPITYKNGIGNTVLHNAVTSQDLKILKLVIVENFEQTILDNPQTIQDCKGNFKQGLGKVLTMKNDKGLTPLALGIEIGGSQVFRLLLEIYKQIESTSPALKVFTNALSANDNSSLSEPPLIKAMRKDRYDILEMIFKLPHQKYLDYEQVLCLTDSSFKNVLHHAVMKQHPEIVRKLLWYDSDNGKLRLQQDTKKKTPLQYDEGGMFKGSFETVWDAAKNENIERLKQVIPMPAPTELQGGKHLVNDPTPWSFNTPLHIAVKAKKLKSVKCLIWDLKANADAQNKSGLTPKDFCKKFITDKEVQLVMMGLLNRTQKDIKVDKNAEKKREKEAQRKQDKKEMDNLKDKMRKAIEAKGFDIKQMFAMFDQNGDGAFDQMEFETAVQVLELDVKLKDLRRLIDLSDENKDGKVDVNEFTNMLYSDVADEEEVDFAIGSDTD